MLGGWCWWRGRPSSCFRFPPSPKKTMATPHNLKIQTSSLDFSLSSPLIGFPAITTLPSPLPWSQALHTLYMPSFSSSSRMYLSFFRDSSAKKASLKLKFNWHHENCASDTNRQTAKCQFLNSEEYLCAWTGNKTWTSQSANELKVQVPSPHLLELFGSTE